MRTGAPPLLPGFQVKTSLILVAGRRFRERVYGEKPSANNRPCKPQQQSNHSIPTSESNAIAGERFRAPANRRRCARSVEPVQLPEGPRPTMGQALLAAGRKLPGIQTSIDPFQGSPRAARTRSPSTPRSAPFFSHCEKVIERRRGDGDWPIQGAEDHHRNVAGRRLGAQISHTE